MEIIDLGNHNAFGQVIILFTLVDDQIIKKMNDFNNGNPEIDKKEFIKNTLSEKLTKKDFSLLGSMTDLRNNLAHDCINVPTYSRIFCGDIGINDGKIEFNNLYKSTRLCRKFTFVKIHKTLSIINKQVLVPRVFLASL